MATHSLPSQAFQGGAGFDVGRLVRDLIARWTRPAVARSADSPAAAARRVRAYADRIRERDPRMAAELAAAADRHERLHER